jgi:hypothetical protein
MKTKTATNYSSLIGGYRPTDVDVTDSPIDFVNDYRKYLQNTDNGKRSLEIAWSSTVARNMLDQYPE